MKIIEPSVEVVFHYPYMGQSNQQDFLEVVGRTCYKSEEKIASGTSSKFIKMIKDRGHHAMLEHCFASVKFVCDRGVSHELVRHRLAAFAQECIVGDTKVTKNKTIKELFDRSCIKYGKTHNKTIHLRSCREDNNIVPNKMISVMYKGKENVFKTKTKLGYEICTTINHEFMIPNGKFVPLSSLIVGNNVMVNGRLCLLKISDEELIDNYLSKKLSSREISDKYNVPYRTVLERLKRIGIFVKHYNDKNKWKYNKNHNSESYSKMAKTIRKQYKKGRKIWNKGLRENDSESVRRQSKSLRKNHYNNVSGKNNSNWKGGISQNYCYSIVPNSDCILCKSLGTREIHHIDKNRKNNKKSNLIRVCVNCHKKLHNGWHIGKIAHQDKIVSIEPVGVKDVYDIEMMNPYNNYIANGFVVHNSTRYCNYSKDKFDNSIRIINPSNDCIATEKVTPEKVLSRRYDLFEQIEKHYMWEIEQGIKPQIARGVLPTALKTEIWISANLREWMHIFSLRCALTAHPQMIQVMNMALKVFQKEVPELFEDIGGVK